MNATNFKILLESTTAMTELTDHLAYNGHMPLDILDIPFDTLDDLKEAIPSEYRYEGLVAKVLNTNTDSIMKEYWWKGDSETGSWDKLTTTSSGGNVELSGDDYIKVDTSAGTISANVLKLEDAETEIISAVIHVIDPEDGDYGNWTCLHMYKEDMSGYTAWYAPNGFTIYISGTPEVGDVFDTCYYKDGDKIEILKTGYTNTVISLNRVAGLASATDVKAQISTLEQNITTIAEDGAVTVITFPSEKLEDADIEVGKQGETTYLIGIENDENNSFYTTIGATSADTLDTYFSKLKKSRVLLYGNVYNYIPVSYIQKTEMDGEGEVLILTWHTHYYEPRDDEKIANNLADCIVIISFEGKHVEFAMTQWPEDEAHMTSPYLVGFETTSSSNDSGETIITIQLCDVNGDYLKSSQIIEWNQKGYKVCFGLYDRENNKFISGGTNYEIITDDDTFAIRWTNLERGVSVGNTHYYTNKYSVIVFDDNGKSSYNDTTDTPLSGSQFYWAPIQNASGDTYITPSITRSSNPATQYYLKIKANTKTMAYATESNNGLAIAYDVKQYVDGRTSGKTVTSTMVNTLWTLVQMADYGTQDVTTQMKDFEKEWGVTPTIVGSIVATYTGGTVKTGTSLSDLSGLTVTGVYKDGTSIEIDSDDYTLSGTINDGSNTITVTYGNLTTTFMVFGDSTLEINTNPINEELD